MNKKSYTIKFHSVIDVITNSSQEMFVIRKEKELDIVDAVIKYKCEKLGEFAIEWYNREYTISYNEYRDTIEIDSFLNMPDEIRELITDYFEGE